jgi:photosystem II stability/assembly factor-like uncharacterized protein
MIKMKRLITFLCLINLVGSVCYSQQQPASPLVNSYKEHLLKKDESIYGLNWIQLGPTINSALVETLQVDQNHPGVMYAGFGSGNLWKTINNGLTWKPIFENQSAYGIGDIALAPSNTDIIYLGTGETLKKPRNFTMPGTGIYRSNDGGENWIHLGLEDSWHIGEIAVHPKNPDIVYVAVLGHFWSTNKNRGVYRSLNGGQTWEHVLYVDEKTGANNIVISPSDPNVLYASMWENYPLYNGKNSGVYKSTDAGKTWAKSNTGLPQGENIGRIGLAISNTNQDKVYALFDNRDKKKNDIHDKDLGAAEVYRTLDGGVTWKRTHQEELMIFAALGWYFADIYVDPSNDEEIYALGIRLARSSDGGKSFSFVAGDVYHLFPSPATPLHLDQAELWINPTNSNHLALGNDGGFYVSYDKGQTWMHYNNIPTGEFYDITLDEGDPYTIYGGTQDDASVYGKSNEWIPKFYDGWKYLWIDPWSGGDGCITVLDPKDNNTVYYSSQEGGIRRMNLAQGNSKSAYPRIEALKDKLHYNFISPYFLSTYNNSNLYLGGNFVLKSTDKGDNWKAISPDLTMGKDKDKTSLAAGALAESPLKKGLIYMGTDKGLFWVTQDDGATWTDRSKGLPNMYMRTIVPSKYKESRIYVAMSGMNYDDLGTYLFKSEDYGKSWESMKGNLPTDVSYVVKEDPRFENLLYAGMYRAVYISTDRGKSWFQLGMGMPAAAIADIEIDIKSNDLVVATHGRGIYKLNLSPVYENLAGGANEDRIFDIPPVTVQTQEDSRDDTNAVILEKMPIAFWVNHAGESVISILNEENKILWSTKMTTREGYNQYRWDLITRRVDSPLPYFLRYNEYLKTGKYKVQITTSSGVLQKEFNAVNEK